MSEKKVKLKKGNSQNVYTQKNNLASSFSQIIEHFADEENIKCDASLLFDSILTVFFLELCLFFGSIFLAILCVC